MPFGGALDLVAFGAGVAAMLAGAAGLAGFLPRLAAATAILAGAGLAALPWGSARPPASAEAPVILAPAVSLSVDGSRTVASASRPPAPPPLPGRQAVAITIEAAEVEPNDTLAAANIVRAGVAIDGALSDGDGDWFAVDLPVHGRRATLVANVVTLDGSVTMALFDDAGQTLGLAGTLDEIRVRSATLERIADAPRYYLLLSGEGAARYQLTLATRRR